jgi:D-alanyl-D-alanine endopeptidase (penicillin-binding protein 7)
VIIALLGARTSGARAADLAAIRNWVNGDQPPVAVRRMYYGSARSHHHHPAIASQAQRVKVRFASWRTVSAVPSHHHASHRISTSRAGA